MILTSICNENKKLYRPLPSISKHVLFPQPSACEAKKEELESKKANGNQGK